MGLILRQITNKSYVIKSYILTQNTRRIYYKFGSNYIIGWSFQISKKIKCMTK